MSVNAVAWVLDLSESKGNDRCVLLAIADEADANGCNAFPSIRRIAARARVSKQTVVASIARLEALGELVVVRPEKKGRGRFNRYILPMGRMVKELDLNEPVDNSGNGPTDPDKRSNFGAKRSSQGGTDPKTRSETDPRAACTVCDGLGVWEDDNQLVHDCECKWAS